MPLPPHRNDRRQLRRRQSYGESPPLAQYAFASALRGLSSIIQASWRSNGNAPTREIRCTPHLSADEHTRTSLINAGSGEIMPRADILTDSPSTPSNNPTNNALPTNLGQHPGLQPTCKRADPQDVPAVACISPPWGSPNPALAPARSGSASQTSPPDADSSGCLKAGLCGEARSLRS